MARKKRGLLSGLFSLFADTPAKKRRRKATLTAYQRAQKAEEKLRKAEEKARKAEAKAAERERKRTARAAEKARRERVFALTPAARAQREAEIRMGLRDKNGKLKKRRNPTAEQDSRSFHCESGETLRLTEKERKTLPEKVMVLGKAKSITYETSEKSCRRGATYVHRFGDQGDGAPRNDEPTYLVEDPATRRVGLVGKKTRVDPRRGVIG